jgi:hypothetical protein
MGDIQIIARVTGGSRLAKWANITSAQLAMSVRARITEEAEDLAQILRDAMNEVGIVPRSFRMQREAFVRVRQGGDESVTVVEIGDTARNPRDDFNYPQALQRGTRRMRRVFPWLTTAKPRLDRALNDMAREAIREVIDRDDHEGASLDAFAGTELGGISGGGRPLGGA